MVDWNFDDFFKNPKLQGSISRARAKIEDCANSEKDSVFDALQDGIIVRSKFKSRLFPSDTPILDLYKNWLLRPLLGHLSKHTFFPVSFSEWTLSRKWVLMLFLFQIELGRQKQSCRAHFYGSNKKNSFAFS